MKRLSSSTTVVAIVVALAIIVPNAFAADSSERSESERLQKLEEAVRQLQERNAELEQQVHQLKSRREPFVPILSKPEQKAVAGSEDKTVFAAPSPPPVNVQPGGPELKLTLGGYIQANAEGGDVSAFEGRFGATALKDRFRLRRARITLTGDFAEQFEFKAEGDFEQSDGLSPATRTGFSGTDIFINWHAIPEANFKVGQWKAPFGLEQITPDILLLTIERSLPTGALTPERQIGVQLWGKPLTNLMPAYKDLVTYYAGAFNGNGRNFNNNDNNEFMYVTRLELLPWKGKMLGLESSLKLGGDYLFSRDETGTNISPALNLAVNPDGSLSAFTLAGRDERKAYSFDAWFNLGPFDLIGEYLDERVRPRGGATFSKFEANGAYVQASYFLVPKIFQAVVKWEHLNPGQLGNDGISSITGGLNYYIHGNNLKVMVNYVHTWSDFREANPQLGDDQFDEVLLRMQVVF
ncbi:MAG TPA: porin [Verrucomicrobiae bacterium]|nr:porin [Verrucomicrobiae bacterium]